MSPTNTRIGKFLLHKGKGTSTVPDEPIEIHPQWFGMRADGVADDTNALIQAIQLANAISSGLSDDDGGRGCIILLPSGVIRLTRSCGDVTSPTVIRGSGLQTTCLLWDPTTATKADNIIRFGGTSPVYNNDRLGQGIAELMVKASTPTFPTGTAITLNATLFASIRSVRVVYMRGAGAVGVKLTGGCQHTSIDQLEVNQNTIGLDVDWANATVANNLMINNNVSIGARFLEARTFAWQGGLLQGATTTLVSITPSTGKAVDGLSMAGIDTEPSASPTVGCDDVVYASTAAGGVIRGLSIGNGTWQVGKSTGRIWNLNGVEKLMLAPGRVTGAGAAAFKARNCSGIVLGSELADGSLTTDVDTTNFITWVGQYGVAVNSTTPSSQYQGMKFGLLAGAFSFGTTFSVGAPTAGMAYYRANRDTVEAYLSTGAGPLSKRHSLRSSASSPTSGTHTALVDVSGMTEDIKANASYNFRFWCPYTTADTATGAQFAVQYSGTNSGVQYTADVKILSTVDPFNGYANAVNTKLGPAAGAGSGPGATTAFAVIEGTILTGTAGTLKLQVCSNDAAKVATALVGTHCEITENDIF